MQKELALLPVDDGELPLQGDQIGLTNPFENEVLPQLHTNDVLLGVPIDG